MSLWILLLPATCGLASAQEPCRLTLDLVTEFTEQSVPGLVRVTNLASGKPIRLAEGFPRGNHWYSLPEKTTVGLPRAKVRIEAVRGLETLLAERVLDLSSRETAEVKLTLPTFYDSRFRCWYSGNTNLHLLKLSRADAERYLQVVPASDSLDLVFLSYLRRLPNERDYISNQIVEDSFSGDDLQRLSQDGVLFGRGQVLRHNFGRRGQGYGHALLLDVPELIRPVSIGPGLMGSGTDAPPLQAGIREARDRGATAIWCHNAFGLEDLPAWVGGLVHAQNIFDGGSLGSYDDTFYRYLNLGLRVPFSTGTDWSIRDFSRAYVLVDGEWTAANWLAGLRAGKSFITNGPMLELETERAAIGDSLTLVGPNRVTVVGRGMGRVNFGGLELVYNGKVVRRVSAAAENGYFVADMRHSLEIDQPGWFALRIPADAGRNELGRPLFAHTSPIYIELAGRNLFRADTARELIAEMQESIETIEEQGVFADDAERKQVLDVYRNGIKALEDRIRTAR